MGSQYHLYNIEAVGKNIKWEEAGNFGEENLDCNKFGWAGILNCRELYTPLILFLDKNASCPTGSTEKQTVGTINY